MVTGIHYSPIINKMTLVFFDCLSFILSIYFSVIYVRSQESFIHMSEDIRAQVLTLLVSGGASIVWFWASKRHYSYRKPFWDELREVLSTLLTMSLISISAHAVFEYSYSIDIWWLTWSMTIIFVPLLRSFAKYLLNKWNFWKIPSVIIGKVEEAENVCSALRSEPSTGFNIIAIVVPTMEGTVSPRFGVPCISSAEFFNRIGEFHKIFVAVQKEESELPEFWIRESMKR